MDARDAPPPDERITSSEPARSERRGVLAALGLGMVLALAWLFRRADRPRRPPLPGVEQEDRGAGYESSDVNTSAIVVAGAGLLVVLAVVFVVTTALVAPYTGGPVSLVRLPGLSPLPTPQLPPEPRLQVEPGQELRQYRSQQEQILHSYGWVDRPGGVVRIPIDRAIDLLVQRGLPSRPPSAAQPFRDRADSSPSGASSGRVEERTWP